MQTKVDTKWFKEQLAARGVSMRTLAKQIEIDPSSMSLSLRGLRKMTSEEASRISVALSIPVTEVLRHAGVSVTEDVHSVRMTGYVDCDGIVQDSAKMPRINAPVDVPSDGYVLQVRCPQGMHDGWLLLCAASVLAADAAIDRLCVVHLMNGERVVGTLKRGYEGSTYNIVSTIPSPAVRENQAVSHANPVLWIRPR